MSSERLTAALALFAILAAAALLFALIWSARFAPDNVPDNVTRHFVLDDGRHLTCIETTRLSGFSCDWDHAK